MNEHTQHVIKRCEVYQNNNKKESPKHSINFLTTYAQCNKVKCLMGIRIDRGRERESKINHGSILICCLNVSV